MSLKNIGINYVDSSPELSQNTNSYVQTNEIMYSEVIDFELDYDDM